MSDLKFAAGSKDLSAMLELLEALRVRVREAAVGEGGEGAVGGK